MQFHIQDMTCGSCVRHVNEAIAKVDPTAKVEADTASRRITVSTTASRQQIEKALRDDGYPASLV
jgi:copper chaperone